MADPIHVSAMTRKPSGSISSKHAPSVADPEKHAGIVEPAVEASSQSHRSGRFAIMYHRHKWAVHLFWGALFTAWWIASLVLHRNDKNWVVPFLLWLSIMARLFFFYVSSTIVSNPIKTAWKKTAVAVYDRIPEKFRIPAGAAVTISAILIGTFCTEEWEDNNRENRAVSLFGLFVLIAALWATSAHRSHVEWRTVIGGMLAQYIIALFVLRTSVGYDIFKFIADRAGDLLSFSKLGVAFLTSDSVASLPWFLLGVIPAIIFFISLVQVLWHCGILQWFVSKFATFVFWALRVSGAEAVVAAATPFIGQGESAMLVRPFVPHMTKAEIHQILTCGFATISGSVLVAYIGLGLNAQAMVSACIMSIPASLAISKLRYPETEETMTAGKVVIPHDEEEAAQNALHAFANGAYFGIKIAGTIIASIMCILAFVGLIDGLLGWWGSYLNITSPKLSLELIVGYICYPIAFLLGVPRDGSLYTIAKIIATKIVKNEYLAFSKLVATEGLSARARLIGTYAICGFGNIGSLGIQIGILTQLAPLRGGDIASLSISAFLSGVLSTLTSAAVAGLVVSNQSSSVMKLMSF
ncbi:Solute carrier family 28 member 3 [Ceratocystis platani]|uniref:Solute carrier family 28 member 3 n=1 Tax=Ceratocystis fimbriata f. sp. platani TaxID=88771 RepID=A0A0F8BVN7_CERFI|nr:Solute carrier family 28 member 3 [Ceratocystis platani]